MTSCIFCKIMKGEIPSTKIYEDEHTFAFLDISPVNPGHTLVIPKKCAKDLLELDDGTIAKLFSSARKVAGAVKKGMKADGLNIGVNNGEAAGQVIFHAHVHIIPRFKNDGLKLWGGRKYEGSEPEKVRAKIVSFL